MINTTLGSFIYHVVRVLCTLVVQVWKHPLLTTGLCLLVAFFCQSEGIIQLQLKALNLQQLYVYLCVAIKKKLQGKMKYGYNMTDGPHTWEIDYMENQSPINIDEQQLAKLGIRELLNWNHYNDLPESIQLENTGKTLILRARYAGNVPTLSGADLLSSYTFAEIRFHWGWSNNEGSEHTINHKKFPLEMQVIHRASGATQRPYTSSYDLVVVAYMFELSAHNPYMDPLIQNLKLVQAPGKKVNIAPFPISYLVYAFRTGFYSYGGSLTTPPCHQGTDWFIFPESIAISDFQLRHFRQLLSSDGFTPITRNSRPVQELGNRVVSLNQFCPYSTEQLSQLCEAFCEQQLDQNQQQQQQQPEEAQQQQQQQQKQQQQQQPQPLEEQHAYEEEGELLETIDTTTTIATTNTANICATTFSTSPNVSGTGYLSNSVVIISSGGSQKLAGGAAYVEQPDDNINNCSCDGICGMGDGIGVVGSAE